MKKLGRAVTATSTRAFDYDVLVVGSGFGGSVTALRLTEKGYRVGVLEAGAPLRRTTTSRRPPGTCKRFLFAPELGCYGIQRIDLLKDCMILAGAGVGGGSLVYANTLYEPLEPFYRDPQWATSPTGGTSWRRTTTRPSGCSASSTNPTMTPADEVMEKVADEMGVGDTFHPTPVGVFFGGPAQRPGEQVADPYFGGAGPARNACIECGECMTGCRHDAKNTLIKNYLYLAEQAGAVVHPLTTVTAVRPLRRRRLRRRRPLDQGEGVAAYGHADLHRRAGRLRGRRRSARRSCCTG